jgi:hypothetical protein
MNVREQIAALREEFQQVAAASREDTARVVALLMRALNEMPQPSLDALAQAHPTRGAHAHD